MPLQPRAQAVAALRQIAFGLRASQALYVAAKLNVADHLAQGPLDDGSRCGCAWPRDAGIVFVRRVCRVRYR